MADLSRNVPIITHVNPSLENPALNTYPEIELHFTTSMIADSLNTDVQVNKVIRFFEEGTDTEIALEYVSYDDTLKVLKVTPVTALTAGSVYTVLIQSLRDGFLSFGGRPLGADRTFKFSVSSWSLPVLSPIYPGNGDTVNLHPSFKVYVPPFSAPTGNVVTLEVVASETSYFTEPLLWEGSLTASGNTLHSITAFPAFDSNKTYYWKARLKGSLLYSSPWTKIQNYYFGESAVIFEDSKRHDDDNTRFYITSTGFEDGLANQASWPELTFTFSKALPTTGSSFDASYFLATYESADGSIPQALAGTWSIDDEYTVRFTPSNSIASNVRYRFYIKGTLKDNEGYSLAENTTEYYFSGKYTPLYALPIQLRSSFGSLVEDVSDDLLCMHLYRASLDANFRARLQPFVSIDPYIFFTGPVLGELRTAAYESIYAVHMWVITKATISVLNLKLYETIPNADGKLQIGDFSQNMISSSVLKFIGDKIKSLEKQLHEYEAIFSRRAVRPRAPIKASSYPSDVYPIFDMGFRRRGGRL